MLMVGMGIRRGTGLKMSCNVGQVSCGMSIDVCSLSWVCGNCTISV